MPQGGPGGKRGWERWAFCGWLNYCPLVWPGSCSLSLARCDSLARQGCVVRANQHAVRGAEMQAHPTQTLLPQQALSSNQLAIFVLTCFGNIIGLV